MNVNLRRIKIYIKIYHNCVIYLDRSKNFKIWEGLMDHPQILLAFKTIQLFKIIKVYKNHLILQGNLARVKDIVDLT